MRHHGLHHGDRAARRFARPPHGDHQDGHGPERKREHGRGHRSDHGPGRGRRSGRLFDHGELRHVVLALVAEQPRHGYEIIKAIEDRTAGAYSPSPGVIYPTLTLLEEVGHATVAEAGGRKLYSITAEGAAFLAAQGTAVAAAMSRLRGPEEGGGGRAPAIIRAAEGLKLALRLRLARGPMTEDEVRRVAAVLDEAVAAIERS